MRRFLNPIRNVESRSEAEIARGALRRVACLVAVGGVLALTQAFAKDSAQPDVQPIGKLQPAPATALAQLKSKPDAAVHHAEHDEMLQACAKACSDCQRQCDTCASHCAHMLAEGKKEHLTTLMTCRDCATICAAAAQIVAGGGPFSSIICESCATACSECAKACEKFPDDKHMKACAEECRKCEKACRGMLKHAGHK